MSEQNIRYNDSAFSQAISVMDEVNGALGNSMDAVLKAVNVLNTISSAGGELASAVGGTVISTVRKNADAVEGALSDVKKLLSRLGNARMIMRGRVGQAAEAVANAGIDVIRDVLGDIRQEGRDWMRENFEGKAFLETVLDELAEIGRTPDAMKRAELVADKVLGNLSDMLDQQVQPDFDLSAILGEGTDFKPEPPNCVVPDDIVFYPDNFELFEEPSIWDGVDFVDADWPPVIEAPRPPLPDVEDPLLGSVGSIGDIIAENAPIPDVVFINPATLPGGQINPGRSDVAEWAASGILGLVE